MKNFIKLFKALRKYYLYLVIAVAGMVVVAGAQLCTPMVTRRLIGMITEGHPDLAKKALVLGLVLLVLYALQATGQFFKSYFSHYAAWNFIDDFRCRLYSHIQGMSLGFFHDKQTGQLMSRITADTSNLEPIIAHAEFEKRPRSIFGRETQKASRRVFFARRANDANDRRRKP